MDAFEVGAYVTARDLLEPLVDKVEARMLMHVIHFRGLGVKVDHQAAEDWFNYPHEWPSTVLPNRVVSLFLRHRLFVYGPETALRFFGKRAERGDAEAMYYIGEAYESVPLPSRDNGKVAEWYGKAATAGYAHAFGMLATLHFYGHGVPKGHARALGLAEKGAKAGSVFSQWVAGRIRSGGDESVRDRVAGGAWHRVAWLNCGKYLSGGKCPGFEMDLVDVESTMGPEERREARALGEKWHQSLKRD